MPGWVIGSIVGAWVLLFMIEEAGQYFWKRYVEEEPIKTQRSRVHSPRIRRAPGLFEKVSEIGADIFGKVRKQVLWQKSARFACAFSERYAEAIRGLRSNKAWERLSLFVGRFFRKGGVRSLTAWERVSQFVGQVFRKGAAALQQIKVVKLCLAGASSFVRKYRKSSSHS